MRYHTPIGPIRLDFSYNLNPPIYPVIVNYSLSVPGSDPHVGQSGHFNFFLVWGKPSDELSAQRTSQNYYRPCLPGEPGAMHRRDGTGAEIGTRNGPQSGPGASSRLRHGPRPGGGCGQHQAILASDLTRRFGFRF